jgi:hypothetical protein
MTTWVGYWRIVAKPSTWHAGPQPVTDAVVDEELVDVLDLELVVVLDELVVVLDELVVVLDELVVVLELDVVLLVEVVLVVDVVLELVLVVDVVDVVQGTGGYGQTPFA